MMAKHLGRLLARRLTTIAVCFWSIPLHGQIIEPILSQPNDQTRFEVCALASKLAFPKGLHTRPGRSVLDASNGRGGSTRRKNSNIAVEHNPPAHLSFSFAFSFEPTAEGFASRPAQSRGVEVFLLSLAGSIFAYRRRRRQPLFANVRGHHFLSQPINRESVVLDLGANRGEFSRGMVSRYGCQPRMVEANPALYEDLRVNGAPVIHCAAAGASGEIAFNISDNDEGSSLLALPESSELGCTHARTVTVEALPLAAIMARHGISRIDLLKIDIEGAEVALLETCPDEILQHIDQITVEFHCAPVFGFGQRDRVEAIMRRLARLGFSQYTFINDYTDVLFVSHSRLGTGFLDRVMLAVRKRRPAWLNGIWQLLPADLRTRIKRSLRPTSE